MDQRERVTIDSIGVTPSGTFPCRTLRRPPTAQSWSGGRVDGVDFVKGVVTAITPMAFYETVMTKGYETLVDSGTEVDVNTGMIAAGRVQALIESRANGTRMVDMWVQMDRIIRAIHSSVPEELWPEILSKIGGPVSPDTPAR